MAYLVLALGAFLSIGGALSIFHGAGIVEIERGWTGVIAGSTALTGGIITMALGLILKSLLDLQPFLAGRAAAPRLADNLVLTENLDGRHAHADGQELSLASPAAEPPSSMPVERESDRRDAMLAASDPAIEVERPFGAPSERPRIRALPVADHFDPSRTEHEPPLLDEVLHEDALHEDALHEDAGTADEPAQPPMLEPTAAKSRFKINFKRPPPEPLPAEPAPIQTAETEAPAMDDWLDRAFSALDNEPPLGAPALTHPHDPHAHDPNSHEEAHAVLEDRLVHADSVAAVAEAPAQSVFEMPEPVSPKPEGPPALASSPSAVIGRYEADGTSYVMYADGSIDAQSDAGVYRFNSMTELKAFIESAET